MKKISTKEFTIGLSVVIALLVLFFGINYLKGINIFHPTNYYYVSYTNVAGLSQSAPVTINGFKVGLVREIEYEYDNPGHVRVELSLDQALRIPRGSKAVLVTDMLGTSSIELRLNTGNQFHDIGEKLIGENSTGLMSSITTDVMPGIASIIPKVDSLLVAITTIATDSALINSVHRLDRIMANLESSSTQLNKVMNTMPGIAGDAGTVMKNFTKVSSDFTTISSDLAVVSTELKQMPIDSTMANIHTLSIQLNDLMRKINSPNSSAGMLLNDTQLYNNLNNASASLDSLLKDVKKNPKRYISIKLL